MLRRATPERLSTFPTACSQSPLLGVERSKKGHLFKTLLT
jgi:hypothetical protein